MKLTEVFIAWTPASFRGAYHETAGKVAVIPWPDESLRSYAFMKTWGACNRRVHEMTFDQRSRALFAYFAAMTARDGLDPRAAHNALCEIREYRDGLSADMPVPDHLAEKFRRELTEI